MLTHYLGKEEVSAYCGDLAKRLCSLDAKFPTIWFTLGLSGLKMAERLLRVLPATFRDKVEIERVSYDRKTKTLKFDDPPESLNLKRKSVFVIDSAIHSGKSMAALIQALQKHKIKNILSYTLVLKRGSIFIPNYFGVIIDDKDRVYFELNELPNNRLLEAGEFGTLRLLKEADAEKKLPSIGPPFDTLAAGDLLYSDETTSTRSYVMEFGDEIAGFVSFRNEHNILFIDAWATGKKWQGRGIGNATLRWAETWARSTRCNQVRLWAFETAIPVYEKYGYERVEDKMRDLGDGQRYSVMKKMILYNLYELRDYRDI